MKIGRSDIMENAEILKDDERQRCEVWTRVMGYHRPIDYFNIGKQSEHEERCPFSEEKMSLNED